MRREGGSDALRPHPTETIPKQAAGSMVRVLLDGYTIGVTADRRSDEQASLFERRGATVLLGPAIRTLPVGGDDRLRTVTEAVIARPPDVLVANTGIGIRSWFAAAET